jgi:hypothetical protein
MMGPTKLSTIREELRKAFKMSDAELLGWFNRQVEGQTKKPNESGVELHTLELFRDALVKESRRGTPKRKPVRAKVRSKAGK